MFLDTESQDSVPCSGTEPRTTMETGEILLVDVAAPYQRALSGWAERHSLGQVRSSREIAVSGPRSRACLYVIQIHGNDERSYDRVAELRKVRDTCPVVILARDTGIDLAVRLIRMGVADVIELPKPPEELAALVFSQLREPGSPAGSGQLIGQSPAMRELRRRVTAAAAVDSTVLLQGETGTGKGLVARAIHASSRRSTGSFVHVDCAALSPNLIESELFGHEKGAFTDAGSLRRGRFELADAGTIFLDEIGDLDAPLQSKLLRVLQDHSYERVGGTQTLRMRARVVAATSRDLLRAVREGRFRQDLYFRLNVLKFQIPPLRERLSDIPLLVQAGLQRLSQLLGVAQPRVSAEFYAHLADHSWPGNVRELMNLIERCLVQRRVDILEVGDLEGLLESPLAASRAEPEEADRDDEESLIRAALVDTGGNVSRAARRLGLARGSLRYRIRKYGLQDLVPSD